MKCSQGSPVGGLSRTLEHLSFVVRSVLHLELRGHLLHLREEEKETTDMTGKKKEILNVRNSKVRDGVCDGNYRIAWS